MNFSQVMQKIATMLSLIGFQFLFENANFNKIHLQEFPEKMNMIDNESWIWPALRVISNRCSRQTLI